MKKRHLVVTALFTLVASGAWAQAPAGAPAGSTGLCKDGTYSDNATKRGACSGHKGVKEWFAADAEPAKKATTVAPTAAAPAAPAASAAPALPAAPAAPSAAATAPRKSTPAASREVAAGGGPGQVWVNTSSKVYHCPGTKYYGTTKQGSYMTEAAAKAAGNHADHGKACTA